MAGVLCSMVGATFAVASAEIIRSKKGITAVGNAQVDTAQSNFGGASALFDGTGDYLIVHNTTDLAFGTDAFTIEFWLRVNAFPSGSNYELVWDQRPSGGNGAYPAITLKGSTLVYYANSGDRITSSSLSTATWYHVAVSRSGTDTKMFINGTQAGSTYTDSTNYLAVATATIGADQNSITNFTDGHIDEIRVSNSARYTANFTSPTAPFVNDDNTRLLIHANGTDGVTFFEDDNGSTRSQRGLTAIGNAQVDTAQAKFGNSSMLFDGSGDHIRAYSVGNSASGNFTFEAWIRPANTGTNYHVMSLTGNSGRWGLTIYQNGTTIRVYASSGGSSWNLWNGVSIGTVATGAWYHIAVARSGSTWYGFVNGAATTIGTSASSLDTNGDVDIGAFVSSGGGIESFNGWIDEVRVSNSARYTAGFTSSTTPFVSDANTLLLVHGDGTDASTVFRDDNGVRAPKGIAAVGNAQVDTAQSNFGGASALLDGTGDYLVVTPGNSDFAFSGDFTIEMWARPANVSGLKIMYDARAAGAYSASTPVIYQDGSIFRFYFAADRATSGTISANTWYHLAVTRAGNDYKFYVNGTQVGSTYTNTDTVVASTTLWLGDHRANSGGFGFNGHMDEIRISNTVRYTANFTPSTTPFINDANTLLLIHADGTDASTVFIDDNGVVPYTP